jgi:hypothetical protein
MKRLGGQARRPGPRWPGPSRWLGTVRGKRPTAVSERRRRPQPLLKQRMPSGRGAMEQPNITSGGAGVLMVPMMAATGIATLAAFHVDGYSIYSAWLPAFADDSAPAAPADSRT